MANYIVKRHPELDAYVYWNDEADCPLFGGTRGADHLSSIAPPTSRNLEVDARFDRAGRDRHFCAVAEGHQRPGFLRLGRAW